MLLSDAYLHSDNCKREVSGECGRAQGAARRGKGFGMKEGDAPMLKRSYTVETLLYWSAAVCAACAASCRLTSTAAPAPAPVTSARCDTPGAPARTGAREP